MELTKCITHRFGYDWCYEPKINSNGITSDPYRKRVPTSSKLNITKCIGGWNYHVVVL